MRLFTRFAYSDSLQPFFTIQDLEGEELVQLKKGESVSFALSEESYCTTCKAKLIYGNECPECQFKSAYGICMRCDGKKCIQGEEGIKKNCFEREHCVYLALFGENVKVGVSLETRFEKRLVEQGADFGVKIFKGFNGMKAREAETSLKAIGYADRFRDAQKIEWLSQKPDERVLHQAMKKARLGEFKIYFAEETPVDLSSFYSIPQERLLAAESLAGKIEGWKGSLLFLRQNGVCKTYPAKTALGRMVLENTLASFG